MRLSLTLTTSLFVTKARCGTMVLDLMAIMVKLGLQEWFRYLPMLPITEDKKILNTQYETILVYLLDPQ